MSNELREHIQMNCEKLNIQSQVSNLIIISGSDASQRRSTYPAYRTVITVKH